MSSNTKIISLREIFKARTILLDLMRRQQYDTSSYEGFDMNTLEIMHLSDQMDMLLHKKTETTISATKSGSSLLTSAPVSSSLSSASAEEQDAMDEDVTDDATSEVSERGQEEGQDEGQDEEQEEGQEEELELDGQEGGKMGQKQPMTVILVPYRDDPTHERAKQLEILVEYMEQWLAGHAYHIVVCQESNADVPFNRGKLLNEGFLYAVRTYHPTLCVFHDVDLIPSDELKPFYVDAQSAPVHVASVWKRYQHEGFFGGIVSFRPRQFEQINGFPNQFWGWGGEDAALYQRIVSYNEEGEGAPLEVTRAKEGFVTDLEDMTMEEKRNALHQQSQTVFEQVLDALAADKWQWMEDGLRSMDRSFLETLMVAPCGAQCVKLHLYSESDEPERALQALRNRGEEQRGGVMGGGGGKGIGGEDGLGENEEEGDGGSGSGSGSGGDPQRIYIHFSLATNFTARHVYNVVDDLFVHSDTLRKQDTLFVVAFDDPNKSVLQTLKHLWDTEGIYVAVYSIHRLKFNILDHAGVPEHIVLNAAEERAMLTHYNVSDKAQLPDISRFDPVAQVIGLRPGQICKIVRHSTTAMETVYYRYCV